MIKRHFLTALLAGALILLPGGTAFAGVPAVPVPAAAPPASVEPATTAPAATQAQPADDYYRPPLKTDPFKPFLETDQALLRKQQGQKKKTAVKGRPISPLQQAEIVQFRLVGIAGNDGRRRAIVEERATKKFYPLSVGTYIGPNDGRVVEVLADRVVVEERVATQDNQKKTQKKRIPLLLRPEPEEGKP